MDTKVYIRGTHWYTLDMSKGYVKDSNGKYRLVDKTQEPIVMVNQQLSLEELDARLKLLEGLVIGAQK